MTGRHRYKAALVLLFAGAPAWSHVVLDQPTAVAGSSYRAAFRVGHGCDGMATTGITVHIPAGVQGAKPMPKPGWVLAIRTEQLAVPYTSHGKPVTEEVREITWTAATPEAALPDAHYDEFVVRLTLPATPGALWFPSVQRCDLAGTSARKEWTQVPTGGDSTRGLPLPAALLKLTPAAAAVPHH
jgi:periplasmic copper chaperone A